MPHFMTLRPRISGSLFHDISDSPTESGFQRRSALPYKQTRDVFGGHLESIENGGLVPKLVPEVRSREGTCR